MIFDAADMDIGDTEISSCAGDVGVKVRTCCEIEKRTSAPRRKDYMDINQRVCVHGSFEPCVSPGSIVPRRRVVCGRLRGRNTPITKRTPRRARSWIVKRASARVPSPHVGLKWCSGVQQPLTFITSTGDTSRLVARSRAIPIGACDLGVDRTPKSGRGALPATVLAAR